MAAVSLNSIVGFNSTHVSRSSVRAAAPKAVPFTSPLSILTSRRSVKKRRLGLCLSVADSDRLATNTSNEGSGDSVRSISNNQVLAVNVSSLDSPSGNIPPQTTVDGSGIQTPEATNGLVSSDPKPNISSSSSSQSPTKRSSLTAREKLRAARVRSRDNELKVSKSDMSSRVLAASRASDGRKKRSGLPEAPTNIFDDSKRGMPKPGLTFQFPGVGAIHFNEY
ncbi:hypothetical protein LWI28_000414 [Acer negundo]|uniref:Uncharacterized protein n=1 Tax=Acer negundo TaxID=4023 RepID=A0AAD5I8U1_ACENE|nr:hypothetical protein LWI28_000414 [Acer negundo]KAK4836147.1 hypothetical protein QYF36_019169 [Acer negundo]